MRSNETFETTLQTQEMKLRESATSESYPAREQYRALESSDMHERPDGRQSSRGRVRTEDQKADERLPAPERR